MGFMQQSHARAVSHVTQANAQTPETKARFLSHSCQICCAIREKTLSAEIEGFYDSPGTAVRPKPKMERLVGKRDELIATYASDLTEKCGMTPDMDLLTKVTIGCGPSIYNADASTVAGSQRSELETVKKNFLMKKLGLADGPELMAAIDSVIETYGRSERNKYRAVVYYMLVKHFGKESVYS